MHYEQALQNGDDDKKKPDSQKSNVPYLNTIGRHDLGG